MNTWDLALASTALLVVLGTWVAYFARVPSGRVPARPVGSIAMQVLGAALAVASMLQSASDELWRTVAVAGLAGLVLLMAALFLWLLTQRNTPIGDLRVAVGDALLPFAATTAEGNPFHSDAWSGQRTLLKFFRGGW